MVVNNTAFDILGIIFLTSIAGLLIYEFIAIITKERIPMITHIVRPWVLSHKFLAVGIAGIVTGLLTFLILHFYLPA